MVVRSVYCSSMKKEWQEAIQCGDCEKVRNLLENGVEIDSLDEYGQTALMNAARRGDLDLIQLLIKQGAALNHTAKYRLTALMLAVINSNADIVRVLIKAGANVELGGSKPFNSTPLEYAEDHGLDEIATILKNRT